MIEERDTNTNKIYFKCPRCNQYFLYTFDTVVNNVRYCRHHYEYEIDKKNKKLGNLYKSWRDWWNEAIATGLPKTTD